MAGVSGQKVVINNLNKEIEKLRNRGKKGITKATLYVEGESSKLAPWRTGNLANSKYSKVHEHGDEVYGEVGFTAAHAPFAHENPRAGKTGGVSPSGKKYSDKGGVGWARTGQWKFLETVLKRTFTILGIIRKEINK